MDKMQHYNFINYDTFDTFLLIIDFNIKNVFCIFNKNCCCLLMLTVDVSKLHNIIFARICNNNGEYHRKQNLYVCKK